MVLTGVQGVSLTTKSVSEVVGGSPKSNHPWTEDVSIDVGGKSYDHKVQSKEHIVTNHIRTIGSEDLIQDMLKEHKKMTKSLEKVKGNVGRLDKEIKKLKKEKINLEGLKEKVKAFDLEKNKILKQMSELDKVNTTLTTLKEDLEKGHSEVHAKDRSALGEILCLTCNKVRLKKGNVLSSYEFW
ncbi:hypothetical protein VNO78_28722 [Psophocarpus tetragonolobus]|uniref:Uncharacterized protein n=1 Tax=Psophocarpus tetragonolobus TaxID=3891 RepID=A0AAN9X135_PSOTE